MCPGRAAHSAPGADQDGRGKATDALRSHRLPVPRRVQRALHVLSRPVRQWRRGDPVLRAAQRIPYRRAQAAQLRSRSAAVGFPSLAGDGPDTGLAEDAPPWCPLFAGGCLDRVCRGGCGERSLGDAVGQAAKWRGAVRPSQRRHRGRPSEAPRTPRRKRCGQSALDSRRCAGRFGRGKERLRSRPAPRSLRHGKRQGCDVPNRDRQRGEWRAGGRRPHPALELALAGPAPDARGLPRVDL
mmetsp:Transcript_765/g.3152  ORF Transcript_765/g.3152 Transcript_765/m.3152 type:complete len:241 (-) Transcript_765:528-1250(-)